MDDVGVVAGARTKTSRLGWGPLGALGTLAALALTGCGEDPPPSSGNYYPLVDGAEYVYQHDNDWLETVRFEQRGPAEFVERDTGDNEGESTKATLIVEEGGRVVRVEQRVSVDGELAYSSEYDPGFVRFDPAWLELDRYESVREEYERTETVAGEEPKEPHARAHIFTSYGFETIRVAGTTYSDCLKINRQRDYLDADGEPEDQAKNFWFAPNVGKVQEETLSGGTGLEQLVSHDP